MRAFIAAALLFAALPAFAYDATVTMLATPADATHDAATACRLFVDGVAVSPDKPCGQPASFPGLFPTAGTYVLRYKSVTTAGVSVNLSPATTAVIAQTRLPADPTSPPSVIISCTPAPCAPTTVITITP